MKIERNWTTFLIMLSSEKSLSYWQNLKLPVERNLYEKTNLFARGCLEIILYPRIMRKGQMTSVQESWKNYRDYAGILTTELLLKFQIEEVSDTNIKEIFNYVAEISDFDNSNAIYEWTKIFFRNESDPIIEAADGLAFLTDSFNSENGSIIPAAKLTEHNIYRIRKFCNHIKRRNDSLRIHFSIADNVYKMSLPDRWEMLLQDYFFEGVRSSYWWMDSVEYSLQYVNFCQRWNELKEDIGVEHLNILLEYLGNNNNNFPEPYFRFDRADFERLRQL